jgi:hypothetical protein
MATVDSNAFELERRGFQWSMNNTLDDGVTSLLYDSSPNAAVDGNTDGETKLYSLLPGATYFQSTGELWLKTGSPNTWDQISTGGSGNTLIYSLSSKTDSQVTALSSEIDSLHTTLSSLHIDDVVDTNTRVASLSASIDTNTTNLNIKVAALSSAIDALSGGTDEDHEHTEGDIYRWLEGSVNLSNDVNTLSTTEMILFDTLSGIRSAKVIVSAFSLSSYITSEILVAYYEINSTPGVSHVTYGTLGDSNLINFGTRLSGTDVILQLTPAITGLHVDMQHTVVLSTTAAPP